MTEKIKARIGMKVRPIDIRKMLTKYRMAFKYGEIVAIDGTYVTIKIPVAFYIKKKDGTPTKLINETVRFFPTMLTIYEEYRHG